MNRIVVRSAEYADEAARLAEILQGNNCEIVSIVWARANRISTSRICGDGIMEYQVFARSAMAGHTRNAAMLRRVDELFAAAVKEMRARALDPDGPPCPICGSSTHGADGHTPNHD